MIERGCRQIGNICVHIIQSDVIWGNPELNISNMLVKLRSLPGGPSVVIMPELWTCSYDCAGIISDPVSTGKAVQALQLSAVEKGHFIIGGSLPWKDNVAGELFNRSFLIDDSGALNGFYDKTHLPPLSNEPEVFVPGYQPFIFNILGITASVAIGNDILFPEFIRCLALAGTDILFVPAEWPSESIDHWTTLLKARAIENQIFVVACNRCGKGRGEQFGGRSLIIEPDGSILREGPEFDETIISDEISIKLLEKTRKNNKFKQSRNPVLYSPIAQIGHAGYSKYCKRQLC